MGSFNSRVAARDLKLATFAQRDHDAGEGCAEMWVH
jgi:hypothetical protein